MNMKTMPGKYKIADFISWQSNNALWLDTDYQRNDVWKEKERQYLIDSILNGYPIPQIFLFEKFNDKTKMLERELIDGKQRITSILDYINGNFKTSRKIENHPEWENKYFSELPLETQAEIRNYYIPCQTVEDHNLLTVYQIFLRLNTTSYVLNSQELRRAKFFGLFRKTIDKLFEQNLPYFSFLIDQGVKVYSREEIIRMKVQEDFSRMLYFLIEGFANDGNKEIDEFYKRFDGDNTFNEQEMLLKFNSLISIVCNMLDKFFQKYPIQKLCNRKYIFTFFMLEHTYQHSLQNLDLDKFKKLDLAIKYLLSTSKNKDKAAEFMDIINDEELLLMAKKCNDFHTLSTTTSKNKLDRIELLYKYFYK